MERYTTVQNDVPQVFGHTVAPLAWIWSCRLFPWENLINQNRAGAASTPHICFPCHPAHLFSRTFCCSTKLYIYGEISTAVSLSVLDGKCHTVCGAWRSQDGWRAFYVDGIKIASRACHVIETPGVWILAQEQDSIGGSFSASQTYSGDLSCFNLWDRVLSPVDTVRLRQGNVFDWTSNAWTLHGDVSYSDNLCGMRVCANTFHVYTNTFHVYANTFHVCANTFHVCANTFHVFASTFHVCASTFHVCANTFHVCANTFHVCTNTFHVCANTFHVCANTFHICANTFHVCTEKTSLSACRASKT
ncbi:hypothetical protein Bbelb_064150 [Branchiostoma belcheri]|nr:hypothetical protein Bbelb_064150 [Branchiostoma belcheri]